MSNEYADDGVAGKIHEIITAQTNALKKTLRQEILEQNERHFRELKEIASCRLTEVENIYGGEKEGNTGPQSSKKSRVHPAGPAGRLRPKFTEVAKNAVSATAVTSHLAVLKDKRPQPKILSDQYDSALETLYIKEWPNAVPEYKNKHRCCHRDPERDNDSWKILKKVFPPYLFYFLVFAGAIPHRNKPCFAVMITFWICFICLLGYFVGTSVLTFAFHVGCTADSNCQIAHAAHAAGQFDYSMLISFLLTTMANILSIALVHTYLRDLLQSHELQTLISSVRPGRIRETTHGWIGLFVFYCVNTFFLIACAVATMIDADDPRYIILLVLFLFYLAAPFVHVLVFFLVNHAMCLCYDDWTTKMLGATLQHSGESRLVQFNLLERLKARVALCALTTRNTRVLLVPSVLAILGFCFNILSCLIKPGHTAFTQALFAFLDSALMLSLPIFFALYVSWRMDILESVVAQASLRKISDYLQHAPKGWMLGQQSSLNLEVLARGASVLTVLMAFSTFYVQSGQESIELPWATQVKYEPFGTCADGIRTGLEQHIDCGPPESSCPQTCREKYGEYILISADRECGDVDGYVHITTQRACAAAHNTWARLNNRSSFVRHAVVYEGAPIAGHKDAFFELPYLAEWEHATWADGFRCGAYNRPRFSLGLEAMPRISFPAVFSSWTTSSEVQKPVTYLCFAKRARACEAQASDTGNGHFEEMMSCHAPLQQGNSAWRNISAPLPTESTSWTEGSEMAEFRVVKNNNNDCAEIHLHNSELQIGAQVVFALTCNVTAPVDPSVSVAGNTSAHAEPATIACPKDNIVRLSVQSGRKITISPTRIRSTLMISPTPNMTDMTVHRLKLKPQEITVKPNSTLVLVVDRTSDLRQVSLCF